MCMKKLGARLLIIVVSPQFGYNLVNKTYNFFTKNRHRKVLIEKMARKLLLFKGGGIATIKAK